MNTTTINLARQRHLLLRMRFQLLGGLTFAILLPALIRMSVDPRVIWSSNMQATIFAPLVAHTSGYMLYKRIGNFPGAKTGWAAEGCCTGSIGISVDRSMNFDLKSLLSDRRVIEPRTLRMVDFFTDLPVSARN
ncbi:hypothetical protein [Mesorhizobium sp. L-2-11]|uniref:hypothetical protein n=1 Tax=Mesorhizobium sp. L-2-11 TaxID=2744521 RepID=UPI001925C3FB|nr:hypothetical protein [Mesorhizobium sp. L-2-11]